MQQPCYRPLVVRAQDLLLASPLFSCLSTSLYTHSYFIHININIFVTSPYGSLCLDNAHVGMYHINMDIDSFYVLVIWASESFFNWCAIFSIVSHRAKM